MIDHHTLITYGAIVLGFVFIPGPATLLTVARSATSGLRAGIATGAGITVGDMVHTMFAVVGISAVVATSAALFTLLKIMGAAYLFYLGVKAMIAKAPATPDERREPIAPFAAFKQGLLTEVLNPKTAIFFLAFLPQFVRPENGAVFMQLSIFGVLFALLGFVSTLFFAVSASGLYGILRRHPKVWNWQNKVLGGIYCGLGLRLVLQQR
jgi:threonine/homoserine/homoserine lactone efflux protein